MVAKLRIGWSAYHRYVETLGDLVKKSRWRPNVVVCISRGGLPVGLMLSEYLKKPLGVITVQSYQGTKQGKLKFNKHISTIAPIRGKILLADDLVDSGRTLKATKRYLSRMGEVRTAVMFRKVASRFVPDYFVRDMPQDKWIVYPYDK